MRAPSAAERQVFAVERRDGSAIVSSHRSDPGAPAQGLEIVHENISEVVLLGALAMATLPAAHGGIVLGILPLATVAAAAIFAHERPSLKFWLVSATGAIIVLTFVSRRNGVEVLSAGDLFLLGIVIRRCNWICSFRSACGPYAWMGSCILAGRDLPPASRPHRPVFYEGPSAQVGWLFRAKCEVMDAPKITLLLNVELSYRDSVARSAFDALLARGHSRQTAFDLLFRAKVFSILEEEYGLDDRWPAVAAAIRDGRLVADLFPEGLYTPEGPKN